MGLLLFFGAAAPVEVVVIKSLFIQASSISNSRISSAFQINYTPSGWDGVKVEGEFLLVRAINNLKTVTTSSVIPAALLSGNPGFFQGILDPR
jgi:hypothetical protein